MSDVIFSNEQKSAEIADSGKLIGALYEENFGDLLPYVKDDDVTDINWNGMALWIDDIEKGRYMAPIKLTGEFVDAFTARVANVVSRTFNKYTPSLEAETDDLRITVLHETKSHTGKVISIRKTPVIKRITFAKSVREEFYCPEEIANLMSNAVKAKLNIVIGGLPGVGKTELVKYLTNYIFPRDRVITIEDTMEIHYSKINPGKDCVEMKVDDKNFTYTDAIKLCMRLLPQWILLSEARSREVQYLLESVSIGTKCITTMHTDDIRKVPKRVVNMLGELDNSHQAESMAYNYFDMGILIDKTQDPETGKISRFISQVCMYYVDEQDNNKCVMLYDRGKRTNNPIPSDLLYTFNRAGISDPWVYTFIASKNDEGEDVTGFLDDETEYGEESVIDDTSGISGNTKSRYLDDQDTAEVGEESEDVSWKHGGTAQDSEENSGQKEQVTPHRWSEESSSDEDNYADSESEDSIEDPSEDQDAYSEEDEEVPTGFMGKEEDDEEVATGIVDSEGYTATGEIEEESTSFIDESKNQ